MVQFALFLFIKEKDWVIVAREFPAGQSLFYRLQLMLEDSRGPSVFLFTLSVKL